MPRNNNNPAVMPLDNDEKDIIDSFNSGEWKKVDTKESNRIKQTLSSAKPYKMDKTQITIKLGAGDIEIIKSKATETGIPYQNIIGALVHNYAVGKIKLEV